MVGRTLAALCVGCLLWAAPASASDQAVVHITDDGTIVAKMAIGATEAQIREVLADTEGALAGLSPEVLSVEAVPKGTCEEVTRRTKGMFRPFKFRALRCPTSNGWKESLLESSDFGAYASEWQLTPNGSQVEIVYTIKTELNAPVPAALVRSNLRDSAKGLVERLAKKFRR